MVHLTPLSKGMINPSFKCLLIAHRGRQQPLSRIIYRTWMSIWLLTDLSIACQPSFETNLDYICPDANTEPLRREMSGPLTPPEEASNPSNQQPPSKDISLHVPDVQLQLRSALRKSKNRKRRGTAPSNPEHTRESHNLVEKHYRARLKTQFERLLTVLPVAQARSLADRDTTANIGQVLSRGQVLDMARNRIIELEGMATMYSDAHKERDLQCGNSMETLS
ncbi:hypothetical protein FOXG_15169 [Fusarium oxysporum f. sp. lycopersici 4287]|uniref:BHLH domain-containing protein n=1 Tax=Fusarium oxysporum f. sp. lycopersici (strain 4287 / CBS 123668 / FGSC 9935 / NRRL 34936) TaxID=426428 RepID=A0A0J9WUF8_FUSO4|nr:hypothetical protein FOXG_15169 [Fusarium oxysporum f. sp. lycopersici 4287]KAJ9413210.1 hypothetical protein QL093DRAFT_2072847 [Fusarium oxysporum]KNB17707.1 hypothetical protein FOXG_15169 [Fusarium oxysporum f. sp. lycopersici 4287]